jgi:uncharacterized membrane protein YbhN (UPF0104 family)
MAVPKLQFKHASLALRLSGLLVFPALFVFKRDIISDAIDAIADANLALFILATAVLLVSSLIRTMRWRVLAEAAGVRYPRFVDYLSIYYAGLFLGVAVPAMAASFAPVVLMSEDGHSWRRSSISIVIDRMLETVVILIGSFLAAIYLFPQHHRLSVIVLIVSGGTLAAVAIALWLSRAAPRLVRRFEVGPLARLSKLTDVLASSDADALYHGIASRAGQLAFLSVAVLVLQVGSVVLLAESLELHASIALLTAAAAMVVLVVMLPVSILGIGSREATLVVLFTASGQPHEAAVALGVLMFISGLISRLPGALSWWRRSATVPTRAHQQPAPDMVVELTAPVEA